MPPLVGGLLLLALAVNVLVLPAAQLVPALFAVPVLLAAGVWPPRRVAQVSAAAVACYLLAVYEASRPTAVWPLGLFALTVLGGLGTQLAVQRVRVREVSAAAVDGLARAEVARAEAERARFETEAAWVHAVTARAQAEAARMEAEAARDAAAQFRVLVESVEDYAIFRLDAFGRVATWNPGAARITGYSAEQVIGRPHGTFFSHAERAAGVPDAVLRGAADSGTAREEGWRVRADGSRFWAETATSALRDDGGAVSGYAEVLRDLTERRRDQEERAAFMAALAHDVKNPLAVVKGIAQLLQRRSDRGALTQDHLRERLATVDAAAGQAAARIAELLDLARVARGGALKLERVPIDLVALVRRVVADQQAGTEAHRLSMDVRAPALVGRWDGARLERVIENLLANAVKYSPGGGTVRVAVRSRWGGDGRAWAVLRVRDEGIGIPAADQSHVFDPFQRAANTGTVPGSGLGLAAVRQIVEQHGGAVRLASREGCGAAVSVHLPLDAPPGGRHEATEGPLLQTLSEAGASPVREHVMA